MESSILVSVIICTYNQEDTISQTIDSVLTQDVNFDFEIIIGDDCSTDNTPQICEAYQKKHPHLITLAHISKNAGVVKNWLTCIALSNGKFISSCAGDDFWHNTQKLQIQVDYMENHPECGVLHTDYNVLNSVTNELIEFNNKQRNTLIPEGKQQKNIFNGTLKICAPTACIRKSLFDKYVPVDKYVELNFPIEDWPTWIILSAYSDINYLPVSTVTYRHGHESLSNSASYEKIIARFKKEKVMYQYLCELFPKELPFDEQGYDVYVHGILLNTAFKNIDFTQAKKYAKLLSRHGVKNFKILSALNSISFYVYTLIKKIRK